VDSAGMSTRAPIAAGGVAGGSTAPMPVSKRLLDVTLAGLGLALSSPVWAVLAAAVKLEDGGPVFYAQERVGEGGRTFRAYKFRSMIPDAEATVGALQATEHDARVTRVGRLMRATAMDELPQLWSIFAGDMSFVGPRALRPGEIEVRGDGVHEASQRQARTHRSRPDLRSARHSAPAQVPLRPRLHPPAGVLAGRAADPALFLDHLPRPLGTSR
jgi:lipopolysaccharide/colanic/teichoic acid biosynthesis glycosyltransferase